MSLHFAAAMDDITDRLHEGVVNLRDIGRWKESGTYPYVELVFLFTILQHLWSTVLDIRQLQCTKKKSPPTVGWVACLYGVAVCEVIEARGMRSRRGDLHRRLPSTLLTRSSRKPGPMRSTNGGTALSMAGGVSSRRVVRCRSPRTRLVECPSGSPRIVPAPQNLLVFLLGGLPLLWAVSGDLVTRVGLRPSTPARLELFTTVMFFEVASVITTITELPWSLYFTFVVEQRHGFNKQTLGLFLSDKVKGLLLTNVVFGPPVVAALTLILQLGGPVRCTRQSSRRECPRPPALALPPPPQYLAPTPQYLALYLWAFFVGFSLLMLTIYPVLIAPLFNKYDPLPDGSLRRSIEDLAARLGFPLRKLFLTDGSKRSGHSNAYMYGFFKNKRIVLFDTLLSHCTEEQARGGWPRVAVPRGPSLSHWAAAGSRCPGARAWPLEARARPPPICAELDRHAQPVRALHAVPRRHPRAPVLRVQGRPRGHLAGSIYDAPGSARRGHRVRLQHREQGLRVPGRW